MFSIKMAVDNKSFFVGLPFNSDKYLSDLFCSFDFFLSYTLKTLVFLIIEMCILICLSL